MTNKEEKDIAKPEKTKLTPESTHDELNDNFNKMQKVGTVLANHNKNMASSSSNADKYKNLHQKERELNEEVTGEIIDNDQNENENQSNPKNDYRIIEKDRATLTNQLSYLMEGKQLAEENTNKTPDIIREKLEDKWNEYGTLWNVLSYIRELQVRGAGGENIGVEMTDVLELELEREKASAKLKKAETSINKPVEESSSNEKSESSKRLRESSDDGQEESSKKQKDSGSSLVADYADPSQEPADYFGGDD